MERQMTEAVTITNEELGSFVISSPGGELQNTSTPPKPICFSPNSASE
jgi:hypothetical protein